jgi:hypothetical protein
MEKLIKARPHGRMIATGVRNQRPAPAQRTTNSSNLNPIEAKMAQHSRLIDSALKLVSNILLFLFS